MKAIYHRQRRLFGARNNLYVVKTILDMPGKPYALIQHVEERPGYDRRYAIAPFKVETGVARH